MKTRVCLKCFVNDLVPNVTFEESLNNYFKVVLIFCIGFYSGLICFYGFKVLILLWYLCYFLRINKDFINSFIRRQFRICTNTCQGTIINLNIFTDVLARTRSVFYYGFCCFCYYFHLLFSLSYYFPMLNKDYTHKHMKQK